MDILKKINKYLNEGRVFKEKLREQIEDFLFNMEQYGRVNVKGGDVESITAEVDGNDLFLYWDPEYKEGGINIEYKERYIGEVYSLKEFLNLLRKRNIKLK